MFMKSEQFRIAIINIIDALECSELFQREVNNLYNKLSTTIFQEMDKHMEYKDISTHCKKKKKFTKPYWDIELSSAWKNMRDCEYIYRKSQNLRSARNQNKSNYLTAQRQFDKMLRDKERKYKRSLMLNIESVNTENPKQFWDFITKLGSKKKNEIPNVVIMDNGEISTEKTRCT